MNNNDQKIYFATMHGKEKILSGLFSQINMTCEAITIDTDQYGTFSGEKERVGSVHDVLRKKVRAVVNQKPQADWILASEGTFGPDPYTGFFMTDQESLLLWDRKNDIEFYVTHVSSEVVYKKFLVKSTQAINKILEELQFPLHGVIVHPEGKFTPIYKGIHELSILQEKILECEKSSGTNHAVLLSDLRAEHNPTRQKVIFEVGEKLIKKLKKQCPKCDYLGFDIQDYVFGLLCSSCQRPTKNYQKVILRCQKCNHSEQNNRSDGLLFEKPENCMFCNP